MVFHCVCIGVPVCSMCMCIIFIYLSVDEYLGCFHILEIVRFDAMNIWVIYLYELEFSSFLDICSGVELLDHMVIFYF